eukprot:m.189770 g.189770  ORF g.189770 m.189770 type:complete len:526 (+) comp14800_c0_seq6:133-1710(+)
MAASQQEPQTTVQLHISCSNLPRLDVASKSDPFAVVMAESDQGRGWREVGRTQRIKNTENPQFPEHFDVPFFFERQQTFRVDIYDSDARDVSDLSKHDYVGSVDFTLGSLMGEHCGKLTSLLKKKGKELKKGSITILGEEAHGANQDVEFRMRGEGLDKKDLFGKSDPYVNIYRQGAHGWVRVETTPVIKKTLNPTWPVFSISYSELCLGNSSTPLRFECYDWDRDGGHDLIGIADTTLEILLADQRQLQLINPKKKAKKKGYTDSGHLVFDSVLLRTKPTFLSYLHAGYDIQTCMCVDFTASNGNPSAPSSLHYMNPVAPNDYIQAIRGVGNVIADYDSDKQFPAFGFGARFSNGEVSHSFALNGNESNPYCTGIEGIVQAYMKAITSVSLYGPTNFAPNIAKTAALAEQALKNGTRTYHILMIVTDGAISDMGATKEAIVKASRLPMSIIIVGVGDADFTSMDVLDGDDATLESKGVRATRDIVQFVPFNSVKARGPAALAQAVLAEVPEQFLGFMRLYDVQP